MSFLDMFRRTDINEGFARFQAAPGAVLLDVRTSEEYAAGHLPGSRNLPLHLLDTPGIPLPSADTPVFLYCRSGARSGQATAWMKAHGLSLIHILPSGDPVRRPASPLSGSRPRHRCR